MPWHPSPAAALPVRSAHVRRLCRAYRCRQPANGLETGERPDPEPPAAGPRSPSRATALNHHDLWSLRGVGLPAGPAADDPRLRRRRRRRGRQRGRRARGDRRRRRWRGDETLDPRRSLLSERYQGTFAEKVAVPAANLVPKPAGCPSRRPPACPPRGSPPTGCCSTSGRCSQARRPRPGRGRRRRDGADPARAGGRAARVGDQPHRGEARRGGRARRRPAFETGARLPERVDAVMETVGQATWSHSVSALKPGGTIVISGATSGDAPPAELTRIFFTQLSVVGSTMGTRDELGRLPRFCEQTGIRPRSTWYYPWRRQQTVRRDARRRTVRKDRLHALGAPAPARPGCRAPPPTGAVLRRSFPPAAARHRGPHPHIPACRRSGSHRRLAAGPPPGPGLHRTPRRPQARHRARPSPHPPPAGRLALGGTVGRPPGREAAGGRAIEWRLLPFAPPPAVCFLSFRAGFCMKQSRVGTFNEVTSETNDSDAKDPSDSSRGRALFPARRSRSDGARRGADGGPGATVHAGGTDRLPHSAASTAGRNIRRRSAGAAARSSSRRSPARPPW